LTFDICLIPDRMERSFVPHFTCLKSDLFQSYKKDKAGKFKMHPYCQTVYLIKTCSMAGFRGIGNASP